MARKSSKSAPPDAGDFAGECQRLSALVSQSSEAMLLTDLNGVVLFANPAFLELSGRTTAEIIGQRLEKLHGQLEDPEWHSRLWKTMSEAGTWKGRITSRRADGRLYLEECVVSQIQDLQGTVTHHAVTKRNITHEHQLEDLFRRSQKLEAVGSLMGGIAHDFNNQIGTILGHSDLLLQQLGGFAEHAKRLEAIRTAAQKTAQITRQLLGFSQRQQSAIRVLDLNAHLQEMLDMLRRLVGENIEVDFQPGDGNLRVRMDPGCLDQVIVNLIVHARDMMREGGWLRIETAEVELAGGMDSRQAPLPAGSYVMLAFRDTGSGPPGPAAPAPEPEPYYAENDPGQHLGLGLAAVHGIIRQCGGQLVVRRLDGASSSLIYLPVAAATAPAAAPREVKAPPPPKAMQSILLVEDEQTLREMTQEMLSRQGYKVVCATDGEEALEICERKGARFDLLFTDMIMPRMNGIALAEKLKQAMPRLKFLLMSGYAQDAHFHQRLVSQGVNFIAKPFTLDHLTRRVREVLQGP